MAHDPELRAHQEWLGFVQPVGLVVSAPALAAAQAHVNRNIIREQQELLQLIESEPANGGRGERPALKDFPAFCTRVLAWEPADLAGAPGGPDLPATLDVSLQEFQEVLSPTYAVPDAAKPGGWLLLVKTLDTGTDMDEAQATDERHWHTSPQTRFERLLRENDVPIGILANGTHIRLVYYPRGESPGHVSFPVAAMGEVAGRPILGALHMLLSAERLFVVPTSQRLPAILRESRKYQNEVSTKLADQVLTALSELLRGFQAADEASKGRLLSGVLSEEPNHIYGGLLSTLMRLVFILYAEDRGLLPCDPVYVNHYSVTGLFERLREDAARYTDTMDQRYGAWSQLLTLFRLIHDGGDHGNLHLPPRHGQLFDPDAYSFLEGRPYGTHRVMGERLTPPRVPDGIVYRVLENLLLLDGDRLSYRALDVEQIGSVYEAMMGFELQVAKGPSIGLRPDHVVVNLQDLLDAKPADRAKHLKDRADCKVEGKALEELKKAQTAEDLVVSLSRRISPHTPRVLPPGAMYLQPSDERRRTGSHYTPRSLTEPIVATTFRPIFERLGDTPRPEQILDLKVCDPAMGSGAFLVAACRFLGDKLVAAWQSHNALPAIPPDEDPTLHARRLVAQRCLYGVDKNPFAVDLAKLSLWLATLARDHPFTFLDHSLRCGDSLVGLSREQLARFHWESGIQIPTIHQFIAPRLEEASSLRHRIHEMADSDDVQQKRHLLRDADTALADVRLVGDLIVAAFFGADNKAKREALRKEYATLAQQLLKGEPQQQAVATIVNGLKEGEHPVTPFHWQIEFPEVFLREKLGFDGFVGNPPFLGGSKISTTYGDAYLAYLLDIHPESHGNGDLVAHFFRRVFSLLQSEGALGLIATNTIAQGDTRATGLHWICTLGGTIFEARKRLKWPGQAAVIVSVIHISKAPVDPPYILEDIQVERITAFLFDKGGHDDPRRLGLNRKKSFKGHMLGGMGFTFDDSNPDATPISEMERLIANYPNNKERIFPYIGGEEVNGSATHAYRRFAINFERMSEDEARKWPSLISIVEDKVKPTRLKDNRETYRKHWWQYSEYRADLHIALQSLSRVLVCCRHQPHWTITIMPSDIILSDALVIFALDHFGAYAAMQSRIHEVWIRFLGSSIKDDLRYTSSDCFETFPFPADWEDSFDLEEAGRGYYEYRASLMVRNNEGMTATYNRFHNPDEHDPGIVKLRELHGAMDRAVLDACGWADIQPTCEFLLDYEEDEDDEAGKPSRRKKPWRYRWPDDVRDEVLARLLELNRQRAEEEKLSGAAAEKKGGKSRKVKAEEPALGPLFQGYQ